MSSGTGSGPGAGPAGGQPPQSGSAPSAAPADPKKKKTSRRRTGASSPKRRCISTACVACRRRKSKCDGAVPSCAACASVYGTECVYDPGSDHRRKGVYSYKEEDKVASIKAGNSTLQVLVEAILNRTEDEAIDVVKRMRTCDSLDTMAEQLMNEDNEAPHEEAEEEGDDDGFGGGVNNSMSAVEGERDLARKMGELRLENGALRYIGGTSHLIYLGDPHENINEEAYLEPYPPGTDPITTWTSVTSDPSLIQLLIDKYFNYHYPYFTTLSRSMFERDFARGRAGLTDNADRGRGTVYCSSLLVNAMLALGCHFTDIEEAYGTAGDSRTKGDHFFAEAKRIIIENGEYEKPRLVTVQALALMSVREAGCAREAKGWVYSGMSFRMAQDIGLNLEMGALEKEQMTEQEIDARRITFWGCFLFDKCWSNYLGRLPLLSNSSYSVLKYDVFPDEDGAMWSPFPDSGFDESSAQPSRTRAVALQLSKLCEISSDLLIFFYHPNHIGRSIGKAAELKKLSELHRRLEEWRKELPPEFEPREGQLPNVILMHMFFHLQYIHLFRPFLKYAPNASPLPAHVSPRRFCTANAGAISKLMRLYKKTWNLRQICNIAVYMIHSACTIHLLNLPEKTARRDITHGIRHLEEIAEDWLCARRTLCILSVLARKWNCELPEEAAVILQRTDDKYGGIYSTSDVPSPRSQQTSTPPLADQAIGLGLVRGAPGNSRDLSPLSQLAQAQQQMAHTPTPPPPSIENQMGIPPPNMANMPPGAAIPQQTNGTPPGMGFSPSDAFASWSPGSTSGPGYGPPFAVMNRAPDTTAAPTPPGPTSQPDMRAMPPQVIADGQDWFLHDSARWQQSFESWDMGNGDAVGPGPGGGPMFMFGEGQGGRTPPQQQQQQQQQMRMGDEQGTPGFEGMGASMNGGGWVHKLD